MAYRVVHILAQDLDAAKNIAKRNKNLLISSGEWISSSPENRYGMRTYSFQDFTKLKNPRRNKV